MKHLFTLLAALCILAAPAAAQTLKTLSYNTASGIVAYTGTNALKFNNGVNFGANMSIADSEVIVTGGYSISLSDGILFNPDFNSIVQLGATNVTFEVPLAFSPASVARTTMRALGGSTNTNEPYSGTVALTNTNVLTFSNGVLLKIQ